MRKFEFQVYDEQMKLIDKFPIDLATSPSGLGFTQKLEVIETRTLDYIANQQIKKDDIKIIAHFVEPNSYAKVNAFRAWYGKYAKAKMVLYYHDGSKERWIDCIIKSLSVYEIDTDINSIPLIIQALSPFYEIKTKVLIASILTAGKTYPYSYPYAYGGGILDHPYVHNSFYEAIPLNIKIYGKVVNPEISLKDEHDEIYTTVRFPSFTLENEQILEIDAIHSRVMFYEDEQAEGIDFYNQLDKSKDTFIWVKPGTSMLVANLDQNETSSRIQMSYVQYVL
jgi:hypothetical protein